MSDNQARLRRATRSRKHIARLGKVRLSVYRTSRHIYAQIIESDGSKTLATASTLQSTVKDGIKYSGNIDAAKAVGTRIAEQAKEAGVTEVAFDRSGFRYHGRVKALADAAREAGLKF